MRRAIFISSLIVFNLMLSALKATTLDFGNQTKSIQFEQEQLIQNLLSHQTDEHIWANYSKELESHISTIHDSNIKQKSFKKQLKTINKYIHKNLLGEYNEYAKFSETVNNGKYNCVGSTTLTSLFLSALDIEHEMVLEPSHVYIMAYDQTGKSYRLETTNKRKSAILAIDVQTQQVFANYMMRQNLISKAEYEQKSPNQLFNRYFGQLVQTIDFEALIAVHYYNDAIVEINNQAYENALPLMEKAYHFYENKLYESLLYLCLNQLNKAINPLDANSYSAILKMAAYNPTPIIFKELEQNIQLGAEHWLIHKDNPNQFNAFIKELLSNVQQSNIKQKIRSIEFKTKAKVHTLLQNYYKATTSIDKALYLEPSDIELKGLLIRIIEEQLRLARSHHQMNTIIQKYEKKYPFLYKNSIIKDTKLYIIAQFSIENFNYNNFEEANDYLNKALQFNAQLKEEIQSNTNRYIADIYIAAASYYIRKQDYDSAKKQLSVSLSLAPNHIAATRKLNQLAKY